MGSHYGGMNTPTVKHVLHCPKCRTSISVTVPDLYDPILIEEWCPECTHQMELGFISDNPLECMCGIVYDDLACRSGAWHFEREHGAWICWCPCCARSEGIIPE